MSRPSKKDMGRRPDIEAELTDKYHVGWTYLTGVSAGQFDMEKSLTNQARFEALDEDTVEQYREAVARGDHFPAVIAYRARKNGKLIIIDGNHRLAAHNHENAALDVYEVDTGTRQQTIAVMTYAFNTRHGRPTSEAERMNQALFLIDNGASQTEAAAHVNIPMRVVKRAVAKANADRRAAEVGVNPREWDALPNSSKSRLLNITTDEGFKDAVHLTFAARLGTEEVFELVGLLNGSKSASKQRQIVKQQTEALADRIQEVGGGVLGGADRRAQGPRQRLAMALGQVLALPDDVNAISRTYADGERSTAASNILEASERLRKIALAIDPSAA